MRKNLLLLLAFVPVLLFGNKQTRLFENGNHFYQQKKYEKAIASYDSVKKAGYESASLYFNLGNAYFKLQKYPLAILNYEKAKKLAGNQDDIDFNLRYSNQFITDKIEAIPKIFVFRIWDRLVNMHSSGGWARNSFLIFWLCMISMAIMIFSGRIAVKRIFLTTSAVFLFLFLFTVIFTWKRNQVENKQDYAIITTPVTSIKSAPDEESKEIFIIHEGIKVQLFEKVQDWQKIRLADGKTGWVKTRDFLLI